MDYSTRTHTRALVIYVGLFVAAVAFSPGWLDNCVLTTTLHFFVYPANILDQHDSMPVAVTASKTLNLRSNWAARFSCSGLLENQLFAGQI